METTTADDHVACGSEDEPHVGDVWSATCPCRQVLEIVASKWSALVIGRLEEQPHRFGQLRRAIPGITQKMLTQTLRQLERDGLVHREVLAHKRPPQVEYSLTELGYGITEPLAALRTWSEQHLPDIQAARRRFTAAQPA